MLKTNFHTHSTFCDGKDTPAAIAAFSAQNGFTHLGFSGHMDADVHMDIDAYYREIRSLQETYRGRLDILRGIELDILYPKDCLYDAEYWIGSTHFLDVDSPRPLSVDDTPEILQQLCREHFGGDYYALSKAYYRLESEIYDRTGCSFVGHFDLVVCFNDRLGFLDEEDPRYRRAAMETMEYLASLGVPFEINCGAVNRNRKKELYPALFLLKALKGFGGRILISSDAHDMHLLTGGFDKAVRAARECGFTHTNIMEHDAAGNVVLREVPLDQVAW